MTCFWTPQWNHPCSTLDTLSCCDVLLQHSRSHRIKQWNPKLAQSRLSFDLLTFLLQSPWICSTFKISIWHLNQHPIGQASAVHPLPWSRCLACLNRLILLWHVLWLCFPSAYRCVPCFVLPSSWPVLHLHLTNLHIHQHFCHHKPAFFLPHCTHKPNIFNPKATKVTLLPPATQATNKKFRT